MAKVRKIPAAFQGTRAIPAQYTTDTDIATPEQIASLGKALDKAKQIRQGKQILDPVAKGKPIATSPTKRNIFGGEVETAPNGTPNTGISARGAINFKANIAADRSKRAPGAFGAGLRGAQGTLRIQPNVEKLSPSEAAALKMLESSLIAKEQDPKQDDDFILLQEILGRKQLVDPEQNRLNCLSEALRTHKVFLYKIN